MLAAEDLSELRRSWELAARDSDALSRRFFSDLLTRAPHLEAMIGDDPQRQRFLLVAMLSTLVSSLDVMSEIEASFADLGLRHRRLGVEPADFAHLRHALFAALSESLGACWSPKLAWVWDAALDAVILRMQGATGEIAPRCPFIAR